MEADLSPIEQKYFDTRGTSDIPADEPATESSPAPAGGADPTPKAADVTAEDEANVDEGKSLEDNPGKFVRHGAFHEERMRRKEVEQQLQTFREQEAATKARLEERLNTLAQRLQPPEPVITDPNERLARLEQTIAQQNQQAEQTRIAVQNEQNFYSAITRAEEQFAAKVPDYMDAIEFAKAARLQDIEALGFTGAEAEEVLKNDVLRLSDDAFRRGINPAERFYNFAKSRGWGNEPLKEAPKEQAPADKLKTIAAGQAAGKSLGAAPGTSQAALSLQALADMPQDEFDKIDAKTWRKMMGG